MPSTTATSDYGPAVGPAFHHVSDDRRGKLPVPLTSFVGRADQVARALDMLQRGDVRLLTLTGPGGVGKTRLAIEVASRAAGIFPEGIAFVDLSPITDDERLLPTIIREFEIPEGPGRSSLEGLTALLRQRRMLLVLDNFDQIVRAAPAVANLLLNCPLLKVLATSRIVLNIQGEHEFPVPPLSLPESGPGRTWRAPDPEELGHFDAVSLFVQRARAARPDFELTEGNGLAIVNVCKRLDGLPLAIELAAARTKILTPDVLLTRLNKSLDILSDGARNLPPRLQTMRAAIAWSYELLEPQEQELFQQLSVFAGGFTLEAAEALCPDGSDVFAGIASLINNSLLRHIEPSDLAPRYMMLETVREFGIEQLRSNGNEDSTRLRHTRWVARWAHETQTQLFGPEMPRLLDRFEAEHDNLRAALRWLIDQGSIVAGQQLANDSLFFWFYRGYYFEALNWFESFTQRAAPEPTPWLARGLCLEGLLNQALSNFPRAMELTEQSLSMAREINDHETLAIATYHLADLLDTIGDFEQAKEHFDDALDMFRERNDSAWLSLTLAMQSLVVHHRGDRALAVQMAEEGLEHGRRAGFGWAIAICQNRQGRFASDAGDFVRAAVLFQESLRIWNDLGDHARVTRTLADVADCAAMLGHLERAATLLGAAEALNDPLGPSLRFADDSAWRRAHAETTGKLDPETLQQRWDRGRQMSWDEAIAESLSWLADAAPPPSGETPLSDDATNPLSPREIQVLSLLVRGRTDREIAEALYISPRTAQGHVANIFNKLGVNSRTAAATVAILEGLIPIPEQ